MSANSKTTKPIRQIACDGQIYSELQAQPFVLNIEGIPKISNPDWASTPANPYPQSQQQEKGNMQ